MGFPLKKGFKKILFTLNIKDPWKVVVIEKQAYAAKLSTVFAH